MFTGIIECMGEIVLIENESGNLHFTIQSPISSELKIDQSLSHDGICLTVTAISENTHRVTAIAETIRRTNIQNWKIGGCVNLERCTPLNGRLDGHIVQGHVDIAATCTDIIQDQGSWLFHFSHSSDQLTVEKGSICINGVSLTVVKSDTNSLSVAIIPYTYEHTTFQFLKPGDRVNLEFDIVGKYLQKLFNQYQNSIPQST